MFLIARLAYSAAWSPRGKEQLMTAVDEDEGLYNPAGCPITNYDRDQRF